MPVREGMRQTAKIASRATSAVTAARISIMPQAMRGVMLSPKTNMPTTIAVRGSNAPSTAVGVEPIQRIAREMQTNDSVVGDCPTSRLRAASRHRRRRTT